MGLVALDIPVAYSWGTVFYSLDFPNLRFIFDERDWVKPWFMDAGAQQWGLLTVERA